VEEQTGHLHAIFVSVESKEFSFGANPLKSTFGGVVVSVASKRVVGESGLGDLVR